MRGELETEQTATYWPQVPLTIAALLPHSAGLLNRGPEGSSPLSGAGSHSAGNCDWNGTATQLQPTQPVCGTWLYNCLMSTCFLWALHLHRIQHIHRWSDIPISSTRCTCFLIVGSVEGQYVTFCVFAASFLLVGEDFVAYQWVVDLLPNLYR